MFSAIRIPMATRTSLGYLRKTSTSGRCGVSLVSSSALASVKTGDSSIERRTHRPTRDEHGAQQERDAPAPRLEGGVGLDGREHPQHTGGEQVAQRHAGLRPRGPEAALRVVAVLGGHQDGAAPLAADREALHAGGRSAAGAARRRRWRRTSAAGRWRRSRRPSGRARRRASSCARPCHRSARRRCRRAGGRRSRARRCRRPAGSRWRARSRGRTACRRRAPRRSRRGRSRTTRRRCRSARRRRP